MEIREFKFMMLSRANLLSIQLHCTMNSSSDDYESPVVIDKSKGDFPCENFPALPG